MNVSLSGQGLEFLLALLCGHGLGLCYDCMRIIRGRVPLRVVTYVLDLIFGLLCVLVGFGYAMNWGGGSLRIFVMAGMFLGAVLYFRLFSRAVRALGFFIADTLEALWRAFLTPIRALVAKSKKMHGEAENLFSFWEKRSRMGETGKDLRQARRARLREEALTNGHRGRRGNQANEEKQKTSGALEQAHRAHHRPVRGLDALNLPGGNKRAESAANRTGKQASGAEHRQRGTGASYRV